MHNYQKYLNVGPGEKSWGFYLTTVGSTKIGPNKNYPNNRDHPIDHSFTWNKGRILNGYYVVFITKGEGVLESAKTKAFEIKSGTCFFLFPGVWHRYRPNPLSGWEEYWVGFNGNYPDELMRTGIFKPENPFIDVGFNEGLLQLFHQLITTVEQAEIGYRRVITGITLQMLALLSSLDRFHDQTGNKIEKLISKAKFLLQESVESPVNLEEIARELPMGYASFRKAFKKVTGFSPNQYQMTLRLDKAQNLLATTNLTINEIAFQSGFESIFYFSRMFKKKHGVAPKQYKSQLQIYSPLLNT